VSPPPEVDAVFTQACAVLQGEKVEFVLLGGLAVNVWGVPRTTHDVDFEVQLPRPELARLLEAFRREGFTVPEAHARGFVDDVAGNPLVKLLWWAGDKAVDVDLFLVEGPFLRQVFERRVPTEVLGKPCSVASAADVILLKLLSWRDRDRVDIENILLVQGVPDAAYLSDWARRLGVADRLEAALAKRDRGI